MTRESGARSKLGGGRSSSPPASIREKTQPGQAEGPGPEGASETTIIAPKKRGPDPEKAIHTHNDVQYEISGTTALRAAPDSPEIAANPTSGDDFGNEDDEYISGYKLYVALFSIVSVFFLVLLDFSITATVSTLRIAHRITVRPESFIVAPMTSMIGLYWPDS
jgi:hypothetical protein